MSFTLLAAPIPVFVLDKGKGLAMAVIDYGPEHNLIWVTAIDETGEIWSAPNPSVQMQSNWTMGRSKSPAERVAIGVSTLCDCGTARFRADGRQVLRALSRPSTACLVGGYRKSIRNSDRDVLLARSSCLADQLLRARNHFGQGLGMARVIPRSLRTSLAHNIPLDGNCGRLGSPRDHGLFR